jgi:DNA-binding SARP family transcriptional activator/predicted ATPase
MLRIQLLGSFQITEDEKPIARLQSDRLQALLAYLVLQRDQPLARQQLAVTFWPDTTDAQARTNLRTLITRLREALPDADQFLKVDAQTVQWRSDASCAIDVIKFEQALAANCLTDASALYRGDLLPGCYDDWITGERERLRQAYQHTLDRLIAQAERQGRFDQAIVYAQRLLRHDPLHETTYRHLMRLQLASGDRSGALRTYHACATMLRDELGVEPAPETRTLYAQLLKIDEQVVEASPEPVRTLLVGRHTEWAQLLAAWRSASAGRPQLALITGEAGIGKTHLAEYLQAHVQRQNVTTSTARCYATERVAAYAPISQWLRAEALRERLNTLDQVWLVEVARLAPWLNTEQPELPTPGPLTEAWQRQRLFEALARAVLIRREPLLLFLDDAQWCDRETLDWLHYVLQFDPTAPLLIVGTLRQEEADDNDALATVRLLLQKRECLTEISLARFDAPTTTALASNLSEHDLQADEAARIYRETEGNPLFVVEMMRAGGRITDQAVVAPAQALPPKVQATIQYRLSQLSAQAQSLLQIAAVIGREFTFDVLARASESNEDALVQGLDELWRKQIVREQGANAYDFSHDKIRVVAYTALSATRRRVLHRKVAEAFVEISSDQPDRVAGQIAIHFELAGDSMKAGTWHVRAGQHARRTYALETAIKHYRAAVSLLPSAVEREHRVCLYQELGEMQHIRMQFADARAAYSTMCEEAVQLDDLIAQAKAWNGLAQVEDSAAKHQRALESARTAERLARTAEPCAQIELATALLLQGLAYYRLGNARDAIRLAEETLQLCLVVGPDTRRQTARALNLLGAVHTMLGNFDQARTCRERALILFRELGDEVWIGHILNNLGEIARQRGNYAEALQWYAQALHTAEKIGNREGEAIYHCNLGGAQVKLGAYQIAIEELRQALVLSSAGYWISEAHSFLAEAMLHLGKVEEAATAASHALNLGEEADSKEAVGIAWRLLGMVAAVQRRAVLVHDIAFDANACFSESERILAEIGANIEHAQTLSEWSKHTAKQHFDLSSPMD